MAREWTTNRPPHRASSSRYSGSLAYGFQHSAHVIGSTHSSSSQAPTSCFGISQDFRLSSFQFGPQSKLSDHPEQAVLQRGTLMTQCISPRPNSHLPDHSATSGAGTGTPNRQTAHTCRLIWAQRTSRSTPWPPRWPSARPPSSLAPRHSPTGRPGWVLPKAPGYSTKSS